MSTAADRHTVDSITSDALDELYDTIERVRAARERIAHSRIADAIYCLDVLDEALSLTPPGPAATEATEPRTTPNNLREQLAAAIRDCPARYHDDIATALLPIVERETAQLQQDRDRQSSAYSQLLARLTTERARTLLAARAATSDDARHTRDGIAAGLATAAQWAVQLFEGDVTRQTYPPGEPAGDRGPSVEEAAADDQAHWADKYAGEGA